MPIGHGPQIMRSQRNLDTRASPTEPYTVLKKPRFPLPSRPCSSSANTTETSSSECSIDAQPNRTRDLPVHFSGSAPNQNPKTFLLRQIATKRSAPVQDRKSRDYAASTARNLSDSDACGDLMSFNRSPVRTDRLIEFDEPETLALTSVNGTQSIDSQNSDSKSYSTICDSNLEDVAPPTTNSGARFNTTAKGKVVCCAKMSSRDLRDTSEMDIRSCSGEQELSLLDVLNFISDTLTDVKLWIHEVPPDCRKRIGQCDAFLSYLSARLYKDRDILVGPELFSFVLWFILKEYSSPDEYSLKLLETAFQECKEKSWAADWSRLPISQVIHDLPPSINCQNKSCLNRSIMTTSSSSISDYEPPRPEKPKSPEKIREVRLDFAEKPGMPNLSTQSGHLLDQTCHLAPAGALHALPLDSLSGALANTQLRKIPSTSCLPEATAGKLPSAEEMKLHLSRNAPLQTRPMTSIKRGAEEVSSETDSPLTVATDILYKTGKRNLRRMLDFALTDFFTQSPSLTCCLISTNGPILVHEALFGAQCANWANIRWQGRKRAERSTNALIVDLRQENVPILGLWTVVQHIYTGIFTITADNVFESQRAADYFGIAVITDACLRLLNCLTTPKMVCYTIESLRRMHKESHPLWTLALGRLVVCFDECRNEKIMARWPLEVILPVLEQPELHTKDEVNVYNLAVRWVEADFPRRRALVPQIMNTVRFASMTGDVLLAISSHARILDDHPNLRQEIADLHLKIRMEDGGFEIPPEMDWSIPRRARRVHNAARAYAQSGRDLNVLMLYFCPRVADFSGIKDKPAEDQADILDKYLTLCWKFLLVTEEGRFSGQWIYYGLGRQEMRNTAEERKKFLRSRDACGQSCLDLNTRTTPVVKIQQSLIDEEWHHLFPQDLNPGTKLSNIIRLLRPESNRQTPEPSIRNLQSEEHYLQTPGQRRGATPSSSCFSVPNAFHKTPVKLDELRINSAGSSTVQSKPQFRSNKQTSPSPVRKTVSDAVRLHAQPRNSGNILPPGQGSAPKDRKSVFQSESLTSITFQSEHASQESLHADVQPEKKWYMELAEKMNVFVTGDSASGRQIIPTASSLSLQSEDIRRDI